MLRTGEVTEVGNCHIFMKSASSPAVVSLGLTKGGKRVGAAESVTITVDVALKWLWQWKSQTTSAAKLLFKSCIAALEMSLFEFRPHSLRRGGATFWFAKHGSLDKLLVSGRWQAARTVLADLRLPSKCLTPFVRVFHSHRFPRFPQHLNSRSRAREGGRGRKSFLPTFCPQKQKPGLGLSAWREALGRLRGVFRSPGLAGVRKTEPLMPWTGMKRKP